VLAHVKENPGQRGEQIAAALGTDTKTLRGAMKRLIEERRSRRGASVPIKRIVLIPINHR